MAIPDLATGDIISEEWTTSVAAGVGGLIPWPWFKQVTQWNQLGVSIHQQYWHRIGKMVHCHVSLNIASGVTGAAGWPFVITLPTYSVANSVGGWWYYIQQGSQKTTGTFFANGPIDSATLYWDNAAGPFGAATTAAYGDVLVADLWYLEP